MLVVYHQHLLAFALVLLLASLAAFSIACPCLALALIQLPLPVVNWPKVPLEALEHLCEDAALPK